MDEPDWLSGTDEPRSPAAPDLAVTLRKLAGASSKTGGATSADLDTIRPAMRGLGAETIREVMNHVWSGQQEPDGQVSFTAAQAEAVATVANSMGIEPFQAVWRDLDRALVAARGQS